jgi:hypothetical protein
MSDGSTAPTPGPPGSIPDHGVPRDLQSVRAVLPAMVGLSAVFLAEMRDKTLPTVAVVGDRR